MGQLFFMICYISYQTPHITESNFFCCVLTGNGGVACEVIANKDNWFCRHLQAFSKSGLLDSANDDPFWPATVLFSSANLNF